MVAQILKQVKVYLKSSQRNLVYDSYKLKVGSIETVKTVK